MRKKDLTLFRHSVSKDQATERDLQRGRIGKISEGRRKEKFDVGMNLQKPAAAERKELGVMRKGSGDLIAQSQIQTQT